MLNWIYTILRIVPSKIAIKRIEDYHTHYLGKCSMDRLFWGYLTFSPVNKEIPTKHYVILHLFDKTGKYLETKWDSGNIYENSSTGIAIKKLEQFITEVQPIKYCDIKINVFTTLIDGLTFGLIPDKKYRTIDLEPSSTISFTPPWTGYYDT